MNKSLTTLFAASAILAAAPAIAADGGAADPNATPQTQTEGKMNPTAGGAPSNQPPGAETSDRTPGKRAPTPETQVDRSTTGETSDRTPSHHKNQ